MIVQRNKQIVVATVYPELDPQAIALLKPKLSNIPLSDTQILGFMHSS